MDSRGASWVNVRRLAGVGTVGLVLALAGCGDNGNSTDNSGESQHSATVAADAAKRVERHLDRRASSKAGRKHTKSCISKIEKTQLPESVKKQLIANANGTGRQNAGTCGPR